MTTTLGRPVRDRGMLLNVLGPAVLSRVRMDTDAYRRILTEHPRLIMTVVHGGVISWLPFALAMMRATMAVDPDRSIAATMHPIVWKIPGLSRLAVALSGAEQPYTFPELLAGLTGGSSVDYYAFPESEYCLYGDLREVKPFRFHGFLELSVRAQVPLLLVAQRGSEPWYMPIDMSGRLFSLLGALPPSAFEAIELNKDNALEQVKTYHYVNFPLPLRRVKLDVAFELYYPRQYKTGLSESFKERRRLLAAEGELVRERMQALYDSLGR
ncbi:hypothetical protein [Sorangium sp. So ce1000]|uniref:hypothetical protein n=1 Tax=Sorangium sp. So ce1000 TaxID=3133325 RepID=UPI003F60A640